MFREDLQTVLLILKFFGRPLSLPSTILPDHPTYHQSRGSHFLRAVFCSSLGRVFQIFLSAQGPIFGFYPLCVKNFSFLCSGAIKMRCRVHSSVSKMRLCPL